MVALKSQPVSVEKIQSEYARVKDKIVLLNRKVRDLVEELTQQHRVLSVTGRTKDIESYVAKALRTEKDGPRKYIDPIEEITDLSGVRVICYTLSQVKDVCETIKINFDVVEVVDKNAELKVQRRLGYTSFHFIVILQDNRTCLPEYSGLKGMKTEIQVRTVLQHAWAEIEHRVQYKRAEIDDDLFNKFLALAGMIQIADREFEGIIEVSNKIGSEISGQINDDSAASLADDLGDRGPVFQSAKSKKLHDIANMFGSPPRDLLRNEEYAKAEAVYSAFIEEQPKQASHYHGRGVARFALGKVQEAFADLQKADEIKPGNPAIEAAMKTIKTRLGH